MYKTGDEFIIYKKPRLHYQAFKFWISGEIDKNNEIIKFIKNQNQLRKFVRLLFLGEKKKYLHKFTQFK